MVNLREELKRVTPGEVDIGDPNIQRELLLLSLLSKFEARGRGLASGIMPEEVVETASGKLVKESISKGFITNTRTAGLQISYLTRLARISTNPTFVLGFIGTAAFTRSWAVNELSDASTTLSISMSASEKAGDIEGFRRAKLMMDDIANPDILDRIIAEIPTINVAVNSLKKVKAAALTADILEKRFLKSQEEEAAKLEEEIKSEFQRKVPTDDITSEEAGIRLQIAADKGIPIEEQTFGDLPLAEDFGSTGDTVKANVERQKAREAGERAQLKVKAQGEREFKARRPSTRDPALRVKPRKKESPVSKLK